MALRVLGLLAFATVAAIGFLAARRGRISDRRFRASAVLSLIIGLSAAAALIFGPSACERIPRPGFAGAVAGIVIASILGQILLAASVAGTLSRPTSNIRLERPAG